MSKENVIWGDGLHQQITNSDKLKCEYIRETFQSGDEISIPIIQRKCLVGYNTAYRIFNQLCNEGFINRNPNNGVSKVMKMLGI